MKFLCYTVFGLVLVAVPAAHGLGLRIPDQDASATARGNAFVATADNPAAIYYNPAGITQLKGHNASIGAYSIRLESSYKALNNTEFDTKDTIQAVPQVYYAYSPANHPLSYGLGFYSPYGLGLEWPNDSPFRTVATRGNIQYLTVNPVVAWRIAPTLSLAAGPTINYSEADLRRGVLPVAMGDEFKFAGEDTAWGYNVGLRWQPHRQHAFGINYRSATTLDFDGQSQLIGPPPVPAGSQPAQAEFNFPQHLVIGWSYRPTPAWNIEFNWDWTDWDDLDVVTLRQPAGDMFLPFNWQSSSFYEWGVTRYFQNGFSASAGYIFSENSVPTASFSPAVPDSDRHIFSVGLGKQYNKLRWNAAYQFAYGPPRNVSGSVNSPTIDGRYTYISHAIAISIGLAF